MLPIVLRIKSNKQCTFLSTNGINAYIARDRYLNGGSQSLILCYMAHTCTSPVPKTIT